MSTAEIDKASSPELSSVAQALSPGVSNWTDREFRETFESLRIPKESFRHREHIRLAWIYSTHFPAEEAASRMVQGIHAFAKHHGVEGKYHHTITLAWMRLVGHAIHSSLAVRDFSSFVTANPQLLNTRLLADYYSSELLNSEAARNGWIEPDLHPIP